MRGRAGWLTIGAVAGLAGVGADARPSGDSTSTALRLGTIIGVADICAAHGVEFRAIAAWVLAGLRQPTAWAPTDPAPNTRLAMAFKVGVDAGRQGAVYNASRGTLVALAENGLAPDETCSLTRRGVLILDEQMR